MSSFGTVSHPRFTQAHGAWWPAVGRFSLRSSSLLRRERPERSRPAVDGTFVVGLAVLGFPFPEVVRPTVQMAD